MNTMTSIYKVLHGNNALLISNSIIPAPLCRDTTLIPILYIRTPRLRGFKSLIQVLLASEWQN